MLVRLLTDDRVVDQYVRLVVAARERTLTIDERAYREVLCDRIVQDGLRGKVFKMIEAIEAESRNEWTTCSACGWDHEVQDHRSRDKEEP